MSHNTKILVVDDNPTNVEILIEILEDEYDIQTAASGEEAISLAQQYHPDIILMDIMMPGINGYQACRQLRNSPNLHYTKIIMVSAKAMLNERLEGYQAGADDYIIKPFDQDELLAKIRVFSRLKFAEEMEDILKKSNKELQKALDSSCQTEHIRSEFIANLSHEIRTPMNIIIGFIEVLQDEQLTQEQMAYVDHIYKNSQHLLQIINDILDLSKINAGKITTEIEEFPLPPILDELESFFGSLAGNKGLDFKISTENTVPQTLHSDAFRVKQCLINLVNNAIKFTEQGHVYLKTSVEEHEHQNYLCFDIEDTGIGIEKEKLTSIFEPFEQSGKHTEKKYGGTGLGLSITKQLCELLGGHIYVSSELGQGTTFSLLLPIIPPNQPSDKKIKDTESIVKG